MTVERVGRVIETPKKIGTALRVTKRQHKREPDFAIRLDTLDTMRRRNGLRDMAARQHCARLAISVRPETANVAKED
jgi:hypothetical protein